MALGGRTHLGLKLARSILCEKTISVSKTQQLKPEIGAAIRE